MDGDIPPGSGGLGCRKPSQMGTIGRKPYKRFSKEEEEELVRLQPTYGKDWKGMLEAGKDVFEVERTSVNLKDKWRIIGGDRAK